MPALGVPPLTAQGAPWLLGAAADSAVPPSTLEVNHVIKLAYYYSVYFFLSFVWRMEHYDSLKVTVTNLQRMIKGV